MKVGISTIGVDVDISVIPLFSETDRQLKKFAKYLIEEIKNLKYKSEGCLMKKSFMIKNLIHDTEVKESHKYMKMTCNPL